jgi:hypothetical protein
MNDAADAVLVLFVDARVDKGPVILRTGPKYSFIHASTGA